MRKEPVITTIEALEELIHKYLDAKKNLNYAVKIIGHPGVGKSAIVKEVAEKRNYFFIDTRLAFKENIDLGGYPVPDHDNQQMIYYRPKFIPALTIPDGYDGIVWFLDESNRAHPTVIQTLFQIITEHKCGEHDLPENTAIILAGNLGEKDKTTITEFDDAALDGRLAIFHLKPDAENWLNWAKADGIHPAIIQYITLFSSQLWDEAQIIPNPRGWHQVSMALIESYGLKTIDDLTNYLRTHSQHTLRYMINALIGSVAGDDFVQQFLAPRAITDQDILNGRQEKLSALTNNEIPAEDILWAFTGVINYLRDLNEIRKGQLLDEEFHTLGCVLFFLSHLRADMGIAFLYQIIKESGLFVQLARAISTIEDSNHRESIKTQIDKFLAPSHDE